MPSDAGFPGLSEACHTGDELTARKVVPLSGYRLFVVQSPPMVSDLSVCYDCIFTTLVQPWRNGDNRCRDRRTGELGLPSRLSLLVDGEHTGETKRSYWGHGEAAAYSGAKWLALSCHLSYLISASLFLFFSAQVACCTLSVGASWWGGPWLPPVTLGHCDLLVA